MVGLASWVGMEVGTTASVRFEGQPLKLSPEIVDGADRAELVVTNGRGQEVDRVQISPSSSSLTWSGNSSNGAALQGESYRFSVESYRLGETLGSKEVPVFVEVTEAQRGDAEPALVLRNGTRISVSDVTAIRKPQ